MASGTVERYKMELMQSKASKLWYVVDSNGLVVHGGFATEAIAKGFIK